MEHQVAPPGGDRDTSPEQEAFAGLFYSIAFVLVNLRFYVRVRMVKKLWWDDFFLFLGMLSNTATFGLFVAQLKSGFGRHIYYLSPQQISSAMMLETLMGIFLMFSLLFIRISICLFLLRIFTTNRVWRRALHIIMAVIVVTHVSSTFLASFPCKPVAKLWKPTIKGTCRPKKTQVALFQFQGGVSIFTDLLLGILPIYFLKDVQISFRTKLLICALMSLGVFTGACATAKTVLFSEIIYSDFTYSEISLHYWAALEVNFALIAAAVPGLRPLWGKRTKQNQNKCGEPRRADKKSRLNSTYIMMHQQIEVDPPPSQLETRITAERGKSQGESEVEATCLPDCNGIMKTSDISMTHSREVEGKRTLEHSSVSDRERSVEDVV